MPSREATSAESVSASTFRMKPGQATWLRTACSVLMYPAKGGIVPSRNPVRAAVSRGLAGHETASEPSGGRMGDRTPSASHPLPFRVPPHPCRQLSSIHHRAGRMVRFARTSLTTDARLSMAADTPHINLPGDATPCPPWCESIQCHETDSRDRFHTIKMKVRSRVDGLQAINMKFLWTGRGDNSATVAASNGKATIQWSPFSTLEGLTYYNVCLERPLKRRELLTLEIKHAPTDMSKSFMPQLSMSPNRMIKDLRMQVVLPPAVAPRNVYAQKIRGSIFTSNRRRASSVPVISNETAGVYSVDLSKVRGILLHSPVFQPSLSVSAIVEALDPLQTLGSGASSILR